MASTAELKAAVTNSLESSGTLQQLRAQVRADIYQSLESPQEAALPLSRDNLVINELLREYLQFNGYRNTLSVLLPEARQPQTAPFDRQLLAEMLGITEDSNSFKVPLLYALVAQHKQNAQGKAQVAE
ncbi:TPA: hypothetical protein ACH3X2_011622 [Trebouxia sp. C0005]